MGQRDQDYIPSSIIELDDDYFGTPKSNGKRGRRTGKSRALAVVSLFERGHPRFFKIQVSKLDAAVVSAVARRTIRPGSEIHCDALRSFRAALREGYAHHYQVFDKDSGALYWVHTVISSAKAFLPETYHGLGKNICKVILTSFLSDSTAASDPISSSQARVRCGRFQHLGLC